jgi:hypothetical protein
MASRGPSPGARTRLRTESFGLVGHELVAQDRQQVDTSNAGVGLWMLAIQLAGGIQQRDDVGRAVERGTSFALPCSMAMRYKRQRTCTSVRWEWAPTN